MSKRRGAASGWNSTRLARGIRNAADGAAGSGAGDDRGGLHRTICCCRTTRAGTIRLSRMDSRSRTAIAAIPRWSISSSRRSKARGVSDDAHPPDDGDEPGAGVCVRRLSAPAVTLTLISTGVLAVPSRRKAVACSEWRPTPSASQFISTVKTGTAAASTRLAVLMRLIIDAQFDVGDADHVLRQQLNLQIRPFDNRDIVAGELKRNGRDGGRRRDRLRGQITGAQQQHDAIRTSRCIPRVVPLLLRPATGET